MMTKDQEYMLRNFIKRMSSYLAGHPLEVGPGPIKPSQVRGMEKTLKATGVAKEEYQGWNAEMCNFLRGAATIENYAKAAKFFTVQNDLLQTFCRLITNQTKTGCGIIMGPSKKETSALKKYWDGGTTGTGYQGEFKDLCRCTIVCYDEKLYEHLPRIITDELADPCYTPKWLIVECKVRTRNDSKASDLGYTDTNITLMLPNNAKIEVQVNVQATLYGKMGRPAFMDEACPPGMGQDHYVSMERTKKIPGGCGHVLYELYKEYGTGKDCNMSEDEVRNLSRDYYDHLSGYRHNLVPENIVSRLTKLSNSKIWRDTYEHTAKDNPRNLPAFRPGNTWKIGLRE